MNEKALIQNLENVRNINVIEISSATTDPSAQAEKVIVEYRSGSYDTKFVNDLCFVHRMRTLKKTGGCKTEMLTCRNFLTALEYG